MKARLFFLFIGLTLFFSACLVKSYQPFYLEDQVIDQNLLEGKYVDSDSSMWNFTFTLPQKSIIESGPNFPVYQLQLTEEDNKTSHFIATLFELNGDKYLDLLPDMETLEGMDLFTLHMMPVHSLAKIEMGENGKFTIKWFSEEWLGDLIEEGKTTVKHDRIRYGDGDEGTLVLSANTEALQQFIIEFGNDPEAFDCGDKFSGDSYCKELIPIQ